MGPLPPAIPLSFWGRAAALAGRALGGLYPVFVLAALCASAYFALDRLQTAPSATQPVAAQAEPTRMEILVFEITNPQPAETETKALH